MVQMESKGIMEGVELREGCIHEERRVDTASGGSEQEMADVSLKGVDKPVMNSRKGIARIIAEVALGKGQEKQYKRGSAAYLIQKIQMALRLISLVFSLLILVFIVTSRVNRGRKSALGSSPVGPLGRPIKFDLMLDTLEEGYSKSGRVAEFGGGKEKEAEAEGQNENLEDLNSETLDDPEYWADDNDRDLWEDDVDEYYDMEVVSSEGDESSGGKEEDSGETKADSGGGGSQVITGKRNKGLRSKGVEVSLPSSLTLYGRVSQEDTYINGIYNIVMEERKDGKKYPRLHHGRAIYKKEGRVVRDEKSPELFIVFDGTHEFWTISQSLDSDSKPLAFLPDHGLIPIRHVGPYGARSNSTWVFRNKDGILKDSSVRIVENSSIELPRVPVYITKATHNWHIKHHNHTDVKADSGKNGGNSDAKVYKDPYN